MNMNPAMAAIEVILNHNPEFARWWARDISMKKRLEVLEQIQAAIEKELEDDE